MQRAVVEEQEDAAVMLCFRQSRETECWSGETAVEAMRCMWMFTAENRRMSMDRGGNRQTARNEDRQAGQQAGKR